MNKICTGNFGSNLNAVAVIMAGGFGTRFWPLSRRANPKQFLALAGDEQSMLRHTAYRLQGLVESDGILVATGQSLAAQAREHLPQAVIMAEPIGRNTAPCIGLAAVHILNEVGDVPMMCLASDHLIVGEENLRQLYAEALEIARREAVIITIGIQPTGPDTGLGYIHRGQELTFDSSMKHEIYRVAGFKEKPDLESAKTYLATGEYYWNAGQFVMRPSVVMEEMKTYIPELYTGLMEIQQLLRIGNKDAEIAEIFKTLPSISFDYAVAEKASNILVMPGSTFKWSDVGSWGTWAELLSEKNNVAEGGNVGQGDVFFAKASNCAVYGGKRFVGVVGLDNVVVVDTEDGLLICNRNQTQDVREIVEYLQKSGRENLL